MNFRKMARVFSSWKCAGLLFLFLLFLGCGQERQFRETRTLMDTFCEITCLESDRSRAENAMAAAFAEMERIEKVFSKFDENSEVSKINKSAGKTGVRTTHEALELIQRAVYYSRLSDGAFDITIAPLMEAWGFVNKSNSIPDRRTLVRALQAVGYKNISVDYNHASIRFLNPGTRIDLGGMAKGYAVDRARETLISRGVKSGLVNLGGNMFGFGKSWDIGVRDPRDSVKIIYKFNLKDKALSTSGDYNRFFMMDGKRYSHIIDPKTGRPSQGLISVTIMADSAEEADAFSTAVFVMGEEKGLELISRFKDMEALIVREDGSVIKR
ncbi:MAG: FAD:protein FMN transferase [Candidatus Omnitrophota bacterium]